MNSIVSENYVHLFGGLVFLPEGSCDFMSACKARALYDGYEWFQLDTVERRHSLRFGRRHPWQLRDDYQFLHRDYINRSLLGYIWIYNRLPELLVALKTVRKFQGACQDILKELASSGIPDWANVFSPRHNSRLDTRNSALGRIAYD